jgi:hypothetical protein
MGGRWQARASSAKADAVDATLPSNKAITASRVKIFIAQVP